MYAPDPAALATPIGLVIIEGDDIRIATVRIVAGGEERQGAGAAVREAAAQMRSYFDRRLRIFDLPLAALQTERGAMLRQAIVDIRYGMTSSYGQVAAASGSSPRAIGQACARNPLPILVPCHRVLPSDGTLGPYSAGQGSATKQWLLAFEGALLL